MDLSVPAGMSPAWRGTTVWQLPQRQIWCGPRWRTGSQPCSRSLQMTARAVTGPVYRNRRGTGYLVRRAVAGAWLATRRGLSKLFRDDLSAEPEVLTADGRGFAPLAGWPGHQSLHLVPRLSAERAENLTAAFDQLLPIPGAPSPPPPDAALLDDLVSGTSSDLGACPSGWSTSRCGTPVSGALVFSKSRRPSPGSEPSSWGRRQGMRRPTFGSDVTGSTSRRRAFQRVGRDREHDVRGRLSCGASSAFLAVVMLG